MKKLFCLVVTFIAMTQFAFACDACSAHQKKMQSQQKNEQSK